MILLPSYTDRMQQDKFKTVQAIYILNNLCLIRHECTYHYFSKSNMSEHEPDKPWLGVALWYMRGVVIPANNQTHNAENAV